MVRGSKHDFSAGSPIGSGSEPAAGVGSGARGVHRASTCTPRSRHGRHTSVEAPRLVLGGECHKCTASIQGSRRCRMSASSWCADVLSRARRDASRCPELWKRVNMYADRTFCLKGVNTVGTSDMSSRNGTSSMWYSVGPQSVCSHAQERLHRLLHNAAQSSPIFGVRACGNGGVTSRG